MSENISGLHRSPTFDSDEDVENPKVSNTPGVVGDFDIDSGNSSQYDTDLEDELNPKTPVKGSYEIR